MIWDFWERIRQVDSELTSHFRPLHGAGHPLKVANSQPVMHQSTWGGKAVSENTKLSPAQEYDTLRDELSQSRKYVFERPLVIVGVGAALLTAERLQYGAALPALLTGLLLFNYWFTVNRLMSSARIVAYIQVVLEGGTEWRGWETSLREYRIWIKDDPEVKKQIVESELNQRAVPDALMYYPPIFLIHIAFVVLCLTVGFLLTINQPNATNVTATAVLVLLVGVFVRYCWKWKPSKMRSLIERNIVIWQHALGIKGRRSEDAVGGQ
jgi:hypothetical protein